MEILTIIITLFYLYIFMTTVLLIMDNRESPTTFAWLFLFIIFPIGGILLYIMIGRNWKIINRKKKLLNQYLEKSLIKIFAPIIVSQKKEIQTLRKTNNISYKDKLLHLSYKNSNSLLVSHNKMDIMNNGKEKFERLITDLNNAKRFVHMEYYIWRSDKKTNEIKNILIRKSKEGVKIRILYDAFGGFFLTKKYKRDLKKAGVEIYPYFNFITPLRFHTINYRNHRKLVVIDGKIGYLGGMNMGEEYASGGSRFSSWRDTHFRVEGQAVQMLQGIFSTSWWNTTHQRLFDKKYFPNIKIDNYLPMQIITSGPDSRYEAIKQIYFLLISSAKKKAYVQTPYFIPDPAVSEALKTTALSGVDVRIMITGVIDKKLPHWAAHTYFKELLASGVKIFMYQKGFMHAKSVIVDSSICSVGTTNMDMRSFKLSYELNTLIYDKGISEKLESLFEKDLKHCKEFTIYDYKKLNPLIKFRNSLARLFAPLL